MKKPKPSAHTDLFYHPGRSPITGKMGRPSTQGGARSYRPFLPPAGQCPACGRRVREGELHSDN